jgi:hypothetical protein
MHKPGPRLVCRAGFLADDAEVNAIMGKDVGKGETTWPRANDQHIGMHNNLFDIQKSLVRYLSGRG